jgi:hypothetical protein
MSTRDMDRRLKDGVLGKLAEMAMARFTESEVNDKDANPTKYNLQHSELKLEVRCTDWDNGHLIVYEKDEADILVMLVTGEFPQLYYRGAIRAGDAHRNEWWQPGRDPPCWFVPQSGLKTINEILTGEPESVISSRPNPFPDLQEWVVKYGGYWRIPWDEWDAAVAAARAKMNE